MTEARKASDLAKAMYVKALFQGMMFFFCDKEPISSLEVSKVPENGTAQEIYNNWTFTMPNGGELSVIFQYVESPYRICKYCKEQILLDTIQVADSVWVGALSESWQCPARDGASPHDVVHEPEEE